MIWWYINLINQVYQLQNKLKKQKIIHFFVILFFDDKFMLQKEIWLKYIKIVISPSMKWIWNKLESNIKRKIFWMINGSLYSNKIKLGNEIQYNKKELLKMISK